MISERNFNSSFKENEMKVELREFSQKAPIDKLCTNLIAICESYKNKKDILSENIHKWTYKTLLLKNKLGPNAELKPLKDLLLLRLNKLFNKILVDSYNLPLKEKPCIDRGTWIWEESRLKAFAVVKMRKELKKIEPCDGVISPFDSNSMKVEPHLFAEKILLWAKEFAKVETPPPTFFLEDPSTKGKELAIQYSREERQDYLQRCTSAATAAQLFLHDRKETHREEKELRLKMQETNKALEMVLNKLKQNQEKLLQQRNKDREEVKGKIDSTFTDIERAHQDGLASLHRQVDHKEKELDLILQEGSEQEMLLKRIKAENINLRNRIQVYIARINS